MQAHAKFQLVYIVGPKKETAATRILQARPLRCQPKIPQACLIYKKIKAIPASHVQSENFKSNHIEALQWFA